MKRTQSLAALRCTYAYSFINGAAAPRNENIGSDKLSGIGHRKTWTRFTVTIMKTKCRPDNDYSRPGFDSLTSHKSITKSAKNIPANKYEINAIASGRQTERSAEKCNAIADSVTMAEKYRDFSP